MTLDSTPVSTAAHSPDLRDKFIELEYGYLTQSSFHSDELRDRIFQFYLLIVSTAAAVIIGLTQFLNNNQKSSNFDFNTLLTALDVLALFIGIVGVLMLPIFARLRRVVLECLQGTVLLRRYAQDTVNEARFASAFIWDADSLPRDESYVTASFLLVFIFMLLDTLMLTMPLFLLLSGLSLKTIVIILWTLAVAVVLLTLQVIFYRWYLAHELRLANKNNAIARKWEALGMSYPQENKPQLRQPLFKALLVGFGFTLVFAAIAWALQV